MKLAIVAIMKNEAKHLSRWLDGLLAELEPGDSITLLDTGSTDDTLTIAYEYQDQFAEVVVRHASISPWRFDTARNTALSLADPNADMVWALDLDEFPQTGWRQHIEDAYEAGYTRLRYKFVWSQQEDGSDGVVFFADKLHKRHGFRWKGIAHEWLVTDEEERHKWVPHLTVVHKQDASINRADRDMELMERAIAELPDDDRLQHYYARQLHFVGRNVEASLAFQKHLANPKATWRHERAESMLYLARLGGNEAWDHQWLYRAVAECPERREVWVELAKFEAGRGDHGLALHCLQRALNLPAEVYYLSRPEARDEAIVALAERYEKELAGEQRHREVHL